MTTTIVLLTMITAIIIIVNTIIIITIIKQKPRQVLRLIQKVRREYEPPEKAKLNFQVGLGN